MAEHPWCAPCAYGTKMCSGKLRIPEYYIYQTEYPVKENSIMQGQYSFKTNKLSLHAKPAMNTHTT